MPQLVCGFLPLQLAFAISASDIASKVEISRECRNKTIQPTESLIGRSKPFPSQSPLCHKHYNCLHLSEKISTPKKFTAGGPAQFAMILWFALPGEARVTVRYIISTRVTVLTPAGRGHLHCVTGAAMLWGGKGD